MQSTRAPVASHASNTRSSESRHTVSRMSIAVISDTHMPRHGRRLPDACVERIAAADLRRLLPEERVVEAEGASIAMVHDAGPRVGRLERMRRRFADRADVVVFGHSHLPLHERAPDGFQIFNPGSPTERRRAPAHTMGRITVRDGLAQCDLIPL